jgi:hypothetical protein
VKDDVVLVIHSLYRHTHLYKQHYRLAKSLTGYSRLPTRPFVRTANPLQSQETTFTTVGMGKWAPVEFDRVIAEKVKELL